MSTIKVTEIPILKSAKTKTKKESSVNISSLRDKDTKNVDLEEFKSFPDKTEIDNSHLVNESVNTRANTIFSKSSTTTKCVNVSSKNINFPEELQILQEKVYSVHEIVQKMRTASVIDLDFYNKYIKSSLLELIKTRDGSESFQKRIDYIQQNVFNQLFDDVSNFIFY
jgi:hypothetical protein